MLRSVKTGGRGSCTTYFGSRTMVFFGLSVSRRSGSSSSGFGGGGGATGENFGREAASCAATSGEIARGAGSFLALAGAASAGADALPSGGLTGTGGGKGAGTCARRPAARSAGNRSVRRTWRAMMQQKRDGWLGSTQPRKKPNPTARGTAAGG